MFVSEKGRLAQDDRKLLSAKEELWHTNVDVCDSGLIVDAGLYCCN